LELVSSSVLIRLDTTGPRVTWGEVSGAVAGATLTVAYELDEPQLERARLYLGATEIELALTAPLAVALPRDTPEGWALIHLDLVDDVGNSSVAELPLWIELPAPTVSIVLDTTAPSVTWGAVGGTTAGELLQLEYVSDEAIATADVVLRDGRVVALSVGETVLSALLPPDTPEGAASVRVRDDVGNERVYPALLVLAGTPFVPPPETQASPRRRELPGRRRPSCAVTSTATVRRGSRGATFARARASSALQVGVAARSTGVSATRSGLRTRRGQDSRGVASARSTLTRRRPPPSTAELIALDLL
jgi:hypothetical protein